MLTRIACLQGILSFSIFLTSYLAHAVEINEIRIDQPGADRDEYFELAGHSLASLDGLSYLVIGDQASNSGYIEAVIDLTGHRLDANGLFLAAERSFSLSSGVNLLASLNFENGDNVTHMLVRDFRGVVGSDVDNDNDGILDQMFWNEILDSVALRDNASGGDEVYSPSIIGPFDNGVPAHVFRSVDGRGPWQAGQTETGIDDSPGQFNAPPLQPAQADIAVNVPEPASLLLMLLGVAALLISTRLVPLRGGL